MRRMLIVAGIAAAAAFAVAPPHARAEAPQQLTERGCGVLADMALVARALSQEKVDRAAAGRVMALVYAAYAKANGFEGLRERVLALGYSRKEAPVELGRLVLMTCMRTGGDQDATLGTRLRWTY